MSYLAIINLHEMIMISEAVIFKMVTAQFLDVSADKTNKMQENTVALIIS